VLLTPNDGDVQEVSVDLDGTAMDLPYDSIDLNRGDTIEIVAEEGQNVAMSVSFLVRII
jgi:hypothetical protein